jgi:hypothetical protein
MPRKACRPDLFIRIQKCVCRSLLLPNCRSSHGSSLKLDEVILVKNVFSAIEMARALNEKKVWQVEECLDHLCLLGHLEKSGSKYSIVGWLPPVVNTVPKRKNQPCPVCGKPIKRRHGRSEFHDPSQCEIDMVGKILNN